MRRTLVTITLLAALAGATLASAEMVQKGNLRLGFSGRIAPKKLPRNDYAPVTVKVRGSIGTVNGDRPPQLRKVAIAFNRYGRVSTRGLPVCSTGELEQTTSKTALQNCGGALIGHGTFKAYVPLAGRAPVPVVGRSLVFNSTRGGKPAMLLHIYGTEPVRIAFVVEFRIVRLSSGTFGTLFVAKLPRIASTLGYVTEIDLTFGRKYTYRGHPRSFLTARCAAPNGFPGAVFTLARGSFTFTSGERLSTAQGSNCWVR